MIDKFGKEVHVGDKILTWVETGHGSGTTLQIFKVTKVTERLVFFEYERSSHAHTLGKRRKLRRPQRGLLTSLFYIRSSMVKIEDIAKIVQSNIDRNIEHFAQKIYYKAVKEGRENTCVKYSIPNNTNEHGFMDENSQKIVKIWCDISSEEDGLSFTIHTWFCPEYFKGV